MTMFAQAWTIWPQLTYIYISIGVLLVWRHSFKHGEPIPAEKFSLGKALSAVMFGWFILYKGGFFIPLGVSP